MFRLIKACPGSWRLQTALRAAVKFARKDRHALKVALLKTSFTTGAASLFGVDKKNQAAEDTANKKVQDACLKNVEALVELMHTLNMCLIEISNEYTMNVQNQINTTRECMKMGPIGEHWDKLTQYRVESEDLKLEFAKYEMLIQKVGEMVFYQAVTSLMSGQENEMDLLNYEYSLLSKLLENLLQQRRELEMKLIEAKRDSIVYDAEINTK